MLNIDCTSKSRWPIEPIYSNRCANRHTHTHILSFGTIYIDIGRLHNILYGRLRKTATIKYIYETLKSVNNSNSFCSLWKCNSRPSSLSLALSLAMGDWCQAIRVGGYHTDVESHLNTIITTTTTLNSFASMSFNIVIVIEGAISYNYSWFDCWSLPSSLFPQFDLSRSFGAQCFIFYTQSHSITYICFVIYIHTSSTLNSICIDSSIYKPFFLFFSPFIQFSIDRSKRNMWSKWLVIWTGSRIWVTWTWTTNGKCKITNWMYASMRRWTTFRMSFSQLWGWNTWMLAIRYES